MPILLPLTFLCVGYLLYQVLAGATLALPIAAGLIAGFGASALGLGPLASFALGGLLFMAVIALGRFAALMLRSRHARFALALLFALPAGIAGYSAVHALALVGGFDFVTVALAGGCTCAAVAAHRLIRRPT